MNRNWNGFLPQNELVKLQWAALEESQSRRASERFASLFQLLGEIQATRDDSGDDDDAQAYYSKLPGIS